MASTQEACPLREFLLTSLAHPLTPTPPLYCKETWNSRENKLVQSEKGRETSRYIFFIYY